MERIGITHMLVIKGDKSWCDIAGSWRVRTELVDGTRHYTFQDASGTAHSGTNDWDLVTCPDCHDQRRKRQRRGWLLISPLLAFVLLVVVLLVVAIVAD